MTITQKIAQVVGGHKSSEQATTTSSSPVGTMEQAGAGEHRVGAADYTSGQHHLSAAGAGGQTMAGEMVCVPGNVAAPVPVGEKKFIVTEDHAVQKQRVERWTEHQPVEREYRTTVAETGHVQAGAVAVEGAKAGERVVNEHTCYPTNTTTVHGVAGQSADTNRVAGGLDGNPNTRI